jgi:hypothetical protein
MSEKKRSICLSGLAAFAALAAPPSMAGLFGSFMHTDAPVNARVRMGALELRQDFRIAKYCNYDFDLRLIHTQGRMGELDAILPNNRLPLSVTVDIYRITGEHADRVAHLSEKPRLTGKAPA